MKGTLITATAVQRFDAYAALERRYRQPDADWIWRMAMKLPNGVPLDEAISWATEKFHDRETAEARGTGYDPDEEYRWLPLKGSERDPRKRWA